MVKIQNIPQDFFRQIRKIEIYEAEDYPYTNAFIGDFQNLTPIITFCNVLFSDYDRSIKRKSKNGNYYFEVDLSFGVYSINPLETKIWETLLNRKEFVAVLYTNTDVLVLGNASEPFLVEIQDKIKDDNSGQDKLEVQIFGETILQPKRISL